MQVLVVGAGLAGCCTTHHLLHAGASVTLLDNGANASSAVAAGIINPVVFRRTTLSWRVNELIDFGYPFYEQLEQQLNASFFRKVPIRRLFAHTQERETWEKKQSNPDYFRFLKPLSDEDHSFPSEQNTFGTGLVHETASVNSKPFLDANHRFFQEHGILQSGQFDYAQLDPETGTYKGISYDFIVFCEGKDGLYNPWFDHLPLSQTKGELLTIRLQSVAAEESLNRKCFLMPQPDGTFKTGSTYVWKTDDTTPTEEGKQQILTNLQSITSEVPEILLHEAGVRPTVSDRRPLLGKHAQFPKLAIVNGLGTKGYMIAPLITLEFTEHLLHGKPLDPETDIARFA